MRAAWSESDSRRDEAARARMNRSYVTRRSSGERMEGPISAA
jgi:hypothetical protein